MSVTFEKIVNDVRAGVFSPVYFLMGEEPFFIDVISNLLEEKVLDETQKDFNHTIFYGKDSNILDVLSAARRFPMMADHHLVVVREAQYLGNMEAREGAKSFNNEHEALLNYLENPVKSTILVFCFKYKTIDGRKKLAKVLAKSSLVFESKRIYDNQLPQWIEKYVRSKGYKINYQATQILAEHLGTDLSKVTNEIKKLFVGIDKGKEITATTIEENIGISKDFNIFELQDALGRLDSRKAFRIAKYFGSNQKANPLPMTLAMLNQYFTKLLIYHHSAEKNDYALAAALGLNPFLIKNYHVAARNYHPKKVEAVFSYLLDCDLKSKGVGAVNQDPGQLLVELLFKILNKI